MKYYTQVNEIKLPDGNYEMYGGGGVYTIIHKNKNSKYKVQLEGAVKGIMLIFSIYIKNSKIIYMIFNNQKKYSPVKTIFERVHQSCSTKNCSKGMVRNPYTNRLVRKESKIYNELCRWKQLPKWVRDKQHISSNSKKYLKINYKFMEKIM